MSNRRPIRVRARGLVVVLALAVCCLAITGQAFAYTLQYYFGTPSAPIFIGPGTTAGSQTGNTSYRLFDEATATDTGTFGLMGIVKLTYNGNQIGVAYNSAYFIVYQNGPNTRAGCVITTAPGSNSYDYCDTTA